MDKYSQRSNFINLSNVFSVICIGFIMKLSLKRYELNYELSMERIRLNNTILTNSQVLFFNRVPKTGSQTIMTLLKHLQNKNDFYFYEDSESLKEKRGERTMLTEIEISDYADVFLHNLSLPASYSKHISFIDFTAFGDEFKNEKPIYLNFVREPVDRLISWYYYIRSAGYIPDPLNDQWKKSPAYAHPFHNPTFYKQTFEDCVLNHDSECTYIPGHNPVLDRDKIAFNHHSQIMFFCGHSPHCWVINGEEAFQQAKRNVEQSYAVVGVLEEMEKSIIVLEHYLPRFFKGVTKVYHSNVWRKEVNKNRFKPKVSNYVKNLLRQNLTREVEFFEFCKQRLHQQYLALGL